MWDPVVIGSEVDSSSIHRSSNDFHQRSSSSQWVPSGKRLHNYELWKITIFNGKTHYKSPCSIAMLNYQRVIEFIIGIPRCQKKLYHDDNDDLYDDNYKIVNYSYNIMILFNWY